MIFHKSLKKSREGILKALSYISGEVDIKSSDLEKFEELLIESDMDLGTISYIIEDVKSLKKGERSLVENIKNLIKKSLPVLDDLPLSKVTMFVGVNGTGKTTFSAKYAKYLTDINKKVVIVAADTYRAAAYEQIKSWSDRYGVECLANLEKRDPSSVIFDALNSKIAKEADCVIIDSAGRLHNSINLMKELRKMSTVIQKFNYTYTNLITIDSTTGKNALDQIELFNEYIDINGVVLNKIDGTAKGGIAISIIKKHEIPICFLGVGESIDDISLFNINLFIDSLVGGDEEN